MDKKLAIIRLNKITNDLKTQFPELKHVNIIKSDKAKFPGKSDTNVNKLGQVRVRLKLPHSFFENNAIVDEYDFVESVIDLHHECYHALQYKGCTAYEELESYVSRCYDNNIYNDSYDKFVYELAAERFAVKSAYDAITAICPTLNTDYIMCRYIDARVDTPTKVIDGKIVKAPDYFIQPELPVADLEKVIKLFDDAYEKALETKKPFSKYKDDCVGKALHENPALAMGFKRAKDGKEQTRFAATIVLDEHPELYHELRGLHKSDYDIQIVKDARLRPIVVKQRELPDIDYDDIENTGPDELHL